MFDNIHRAIQSILAHSPMATSVLMQLITKGLPVQREGGSDTGESLDVPATSGGWVWSGLLILVKPCIVRAALCGAPSTNFGGDDPLYVGLHRLVRGGVCEDKQREGKGHGEGRRDGKGERGVGEWRREVGKGGRMEGEGGRRNGRGGEG